MQQLTFDIGTFPKAGSGQRVEILALDAQGSAVTIHDGFLAPALQECEAFMAAAQDTAPDGRLSVHLHAQSVPGYTPLVLAAVLILQGTEEGAASTQVGFQLWEPLYTAADLLGSRPLKDRLVAALVLPPAPSLELIDEVLGMSPEAEDNAGAVMASTLKRRVMDELLQDFNPLSAVVSSASLMDKWKKLPLSAVREILCSNRSHRDGEDTALVLAGLRAQRAGLTALEAKQLLACIRLNDLSWAFARVLLPNMAWVRQHGLHKASQAYAVRLGALRAPYLMFDITGDEVAPMEAPMEQCAFTRGMHVRVRLRMVDEYIVVDAAPSLQHLEFDEEAWQTVLGFTTLAMRVGCGKAVKQAAVPVQRPGSNEYRFVTCIPLEQARLVGVRVYLS